MTGTSYINTNTGASSSINTEISFLVYADKGAKLYKNKNKEENPYFSFKADGGFVKVFLQKNDYMSVTGTNKIEVENTNDFAIDIETTNSDVTFGSQIGAKKKKTIQTIDSDKFYVLKAENETKTNETKTNETKTNETKTNETKTNETKTNETKTNETKTNETKTNVKPEISPTNTDTGVSFSISANKGTSLIKNGQLLHHFDTNGEFGVSYFKTDDSMGITPEKAVIYLEHSNYFPLYVTTVLAKGGRKVLTLEKNQQTPFSLQDKSSKFFVSREKNIIINTNETDVESRSGTDTETKTKTNESDANSESRPKRDTSTDAVMLELGIGHEFRLRKNGNENETFYATDFDASITYKYFEISFTEKDYVSLVGKGGGIAVRNNNSFSIAATIDNGFIRKSTQADETVEAKTIKQFEYFTIKPRSIKHLELHFTASKLYIKRAQSKSTAIHIDKTVEKQIIPSIDPTIKFKVYASALEEEIVVKLTQNPSLGESKTVTINSDKLIAFEGKENDSFTFSCSFVRQGININEGEAFPSVIAIPLLLITEQQLVMMGGTIQGSWTYFLSKTDMLKDPDLNVFHDMRDFVTQSQQGQFLLLTFMVEVHNPKQPFSFNFSLTKTLYHKISVLNLVAKDKFYIECYEVSLLKTTIGNFAKLIQEAGKRKADAAKTNEVVNRISKIAFSYRDSDFPESNLWETMYTSEELLQADTEEDAISFSHFYSIMQGKMPEGGEVKRLIKVKVNAKSGEKGTNISEVDQPKEVTPDMIFLDVTKYPTVLLGRQLNDLLKNNAFALCLWDVKKSFVTRT